VVTLTVTRHDGDPGTYSLELRAGLGPDGTRRAYASEFWLGDATQRP
jgi:hypothetical protein